MNSLVSLWDKEQSLLLINLVKATNLSVCTFKKLRALLMLLLLQGRVVLPEDFSVFVLRGLRSDFHDLIIPLFTFPSLVSYVILHSLLLSHEFLNGKSLAALILTSSNDLCHTPEANCSQRQSRSQPHNNNNNSNSQGNRSGTDVTITILFAILREINSQIATPTISLRIAQFVKFAMVIYNHTALSCPCYINNSTPLANTTTLQSAASPSNNHLQFPDTGISHHSIT